MQEENNNEQNEQKDAEKKLSETELALLIEEVGKTDHVPALWRLRFIGSVFSSILFSLLQAQKNEQKEAERKLKEQLFLGEVGKLTSVILPSNTLPFVCT